MNYSQLEDDCRKALRILKKKYPALEFQMEVDKFPIENMPKSASILFGYNRYHRYMELFTPEEFEKFGMSCCISSTTVKSEPVMRETIHDVYETKRLTDESFLNLNK